MSATKRNLYVGVVPEWLHAKLVQSQLPVEHAFLYSNLATTISAEEVGFYHAYNMHFNDYMGNDFDDMLKLHQHPENIVWLNDPANSEAVQRAVSSFNQAFSMNTDKLALQSTPKSIRQTNYKATPASDDGMLLIGSGTYAEFDRTNFVVGCITTLEQLLTYSEYTQFKIFSVYTRIR